MVKSLVLERAILHQTRFRTPGVGPDARGVVLGGRGAVLFASLDGLVRFLGAYSHEESLDELIPALEIRQIITPLKTRELLLLVPAESSYRMDRVAGHARLVGGLVFTGTSRHFVQYRDWKSPLGYDVQDVVDTPADIVLYSDSFQQAYSFERPLDLPQLIFSLAPRLETQPADSSYERIWITVHQGLRGPCLRHLLRFGVRARIGEFSRSTRELVAHESELLLEASRVPEHVLELFRALPGVDVFRPVGDNYGVEIGYQHPVALESCSTLVAQDGLILFRGGADAIHIERKPSFAPIQHMVGAKQNSLIGKVGLGDTDGTDDALSASFGPTPGRSRDAEPSVAIPLKLTPRAHSNQRRVATIISFEQRSLFARVLYLMPQKALESMRVVISDEQFFVLDESGIEGVPLGQFYSELAPQIYVPVGYSLAPAIEPSLLQELVPGSQDGHIFFQPEDHDLAHDDSAHHKSSPHQPVRVADDAFETCSRMLLQRLAPHTIRTDAPGDLASGSPLPLFEYDRERRFPLWGLDEDAPVSAEETSTKSDPS